METQTPSAARLIPVFLFALACVFLTFILYLAFGGTAPLAPAGYRITVPLPSAANLYTGSNVEISGIRVGSVVSVKSGSHGTARALVQIAPQYEPIRSGASAVVLLKTIVGEGYLDVAPGSTSARPIPDGGTLAASHVQKSLRLDDLLDTFNPPTQRRLQDVFAGVAASLNGRAGDLNASIGEAAPFSTNFADLFQTLEGQQPEIQRLIASSATMYGALGAQQGALQAAVTQGDDLFDATAQRNRALAATLHALPTFVEQLRTTSQTLAAASPDLNRAASALLPVAPLLNPALQATKATTPSLRGLFQELPATLTAGDHDLPLLTRAQLSQPAAFKTLYPLTRQLTPLIQLLGLNAPSIVGVLANVAQTTNGHYITPDGRNVNFVNAVVTVWNEAIGGYIKRLPTNRQNPYPKPGSLLDIASGGLKSYDCRNVNNPEYLPPTGTGTPPCITQGAWTFLGKSAYFPHLTQSPP